jgi:hypothetical protein
LVRSPSKAIGAEIGGFTAAARRLNVSTDAVSENVQALEHALGVLAVEPHDSAGRRRGCWRARGNLHLFAVLKIYGRLQDHLIAGIDALVDLDLGAVIGGDRNLAKMGNAVFDDRDLHAVSIEDDRHGGDDQRRRGARYFSSTVQ